MQAEDPIDSSFCHLHSEEHTLLQFLAAPELKLLREKSEEEDNGIEPSFPSPSFDFLDSAIIAPLCSTNPGDEEHFSHIDRRICVAKSLNNCSFPEKKHDACSTITSKLFFLTVQAEDPIDSTFCLLHSEKNWKRTLLQFLTPPHLELLREKRRGGRQRNLIILPPFLPSTSRIQQLSPLLFHRSWISVG
ncbi:hypothetical protein CDAR_476001 [Caerostris darwini]|uniref:Uncharacterized protein n=1 Tax=Caerostris darwini TaxID=1538125 RepID=A0AAV4PCJ7_9ARAC|nr:hypothetical protein CDAR_476001 [Caerostris darwini]